MELGNHKDLIIDFGDGTEEEIYYDETINKYRGKEIGIWEMKLLIEIAKGEVDSTNIKNK